MVEIMKFDEEIISDYEHKSENQSKFKKVNDGWGDDDWNLDD